MLFEEEDNQDKDTFYVNIVSPEGRAVNILIYNGIRLLRHTCLSRVGMTVVERMSPHKLKWIGGNKTRFP